MSPMQEAVAEVCEQPVLTVPDERRPSHELRFERDLAMRNLEGLDRQRERLMARVFRLDLMLERRGA